MKLVEPTMLSSQGLEISKSKFEEQHALIFFAEPQKSLAKNTETIRNKYWKWYLLDKKYN